MTRPLYERTVDRTNERIVLDVLRERCQQTFVKLPISYEVDYAALMPSGTIVGVVEIKVRGRRYDTLILSARKVLTMMQWVRFGFHATIVVALPDGIYRRNVMLDDRFRMTMGGRSDRGDPDDVEPVVQIPTDEFFRLGDAPAALFRTAATDGACVGG